MPDFAHMNPKEYADFLKSGQYNGAFHGSSASSLDSGDPLSGPAVVDTSYTFGDFLGGGASAKQQQLNQASLDYAEWFRNESSAQQQRAWEEYMSNTQVQRLLKDIKAAGLNPWLALQSAGFGGAVPTGAAASSSAGQASATGSSPAAAIGIGLASAYGVIKIVKAIAKFIK